MENRQAGLANSQFDPAVYFQKMQVILEFLYVSTNEKGERGLSSGSLL
jgi:hypothetical protein